MAWVIFDGTGSRRYGDVVLRPGANEVNDEVLLEKLRATKPRFIHIREDRFIEQPEIPKEPEPDPVTLYEKFLGRDGKWYFHRTVGTGTKTEQSEGFLTEEEVDDAILLETKAVPKPGELDTGPESGTLSASEVRASSWPCRADGCPETFKNAGWRTNHERVMHPQLFKKTRGAE